MKCNVCDQILDGCSSIVLQRMLVVSCLLAVGFAPPMIRPPRPGVYTFEPLPDLQVTVYGPTVASVRWEGDKYACVRYEEERGFVFDEPLASYARRAGVVVSRVESDEERRTMNVDFDGRMKFTVCLRLEDRCADAEELESP